MLAKSSQRIISRHPRRLAIWGAPAAIAWVADSQEGQGESLVLHALDIDEPLEVIPCADALGQPALTGTKDRSLLTCPVFREGRYFIEIFSICHGALDKMRAVELFGLPGQMSMCPAGKDVFLCWEQWVQGRVGIVGLEISEELELSPVRAVGPRGGLSRSPQLAFDGEQLWLSSLSSRQGSSSWRIVMAPIEQAGREIVVCNDVRAQIGGLTLSALRPGFLWIAWHTTGRPGRSAELTRWLEVRTFQANELWAIAGRGLPRRWGGLGEDQGFEYPLLLSSSKGVCLFAKSSHRHWRCDLGRDGWSRPTALDHEGWGCRVRRPALTVIPETGEILLAYRHGQDVVTNVLKPPISATQPPRAPIPRQPPNRSRRSRRRRRVVPRFGEQLVLFGDIHQHTAHSDGTGSIREAYGRARNEYGDDFVAITDHESFIGKRIGAGQWREMMVECDLHDEPGRFVTIPGYEWTGARHPGPGHKCVYWPRSDMPLLGREHPSARSSEALIAAVRDLGGLVFPHHVGWTGADSKNHDPAVQTCWEIVSCHGAYETLDRGPIGQRDTALEGHFLRDQLDAGLRFGFVGGSDGHGLLWHHGISRKRDSHRTGLTAVLTSEVTREAVFEALRSRRCYATSGAKMLLSFQINGIPMGGVVRGPGSRVKVDASVDGSAPLRTAEIVGSGGKLLSLPVRESRVRADFEMPSNFFKTAKFCYLRIEQIDDEVAWSSPIWVLV